MAKAKRNTKKAIDDLLADESVGATKNRSRMSWDEILKEDEPVHYEIVSDVCKSYCEGGIFAEKYSSQSHLYRSLTEKGYLVKVAKTSFNEYLRKLKEGHASG